MVKNFFRTLKNIVQSMLIIEIKNFIQFYKHSIRCDVFNTLSNWSKAPFHSKALNGQWNGHLKCSEKIIGANVACWNPPLKCKGFENWWQLVAYSDCTICNISPISLQIVHDKFCNLSAIFLGILKLNLTNTIVKQMDISKKIADKVQLI